MLIDLSKAVEVQCPYREDATDEYDVLVSVTSVGRSLDVPGFLEILAEYEGEAISGEDLCYEIYKSIKNSYEKAKAIQVDVYATNADVVGFHVQCGRNTDRT